jgi:3'(2'), 5'-bisphosphate nucleotidase
MVGLSETTERWHGELTLARGIVEESALLAREIRHAIGGERAIKDDRSPVTVADFAVQALIATRLAAATPGVPLVAEEAAASLRAPAAAPMLAKVVEFVRRCLPDAGAGHVLEAIDRGGGSPATRFWTLDPIDGTKGFVRGDQYVVALAFIEDGRVQVGVLGCPGLPSLSEPGLSDENGVLVSAARGSGAWAGALGSPHFRALHVSDQRDVRRARVLRSFEDEHIDAGRFDTVVRALGIQVPPIRMDSQAKHAMLAAGGADLFLRPPARPGFHDKIWDQAAGSLIVEEAGGRVTDLAGRILDFGAGRLLERNDGFVASNGCLHDAVLEALARTR